MVSFSSAAVLLLASIPASFASEKLITNYEPATVVLDHANIDRDQKLIEDQLALGNNDGFTNARNVYEDGAFSKSVATVKLTTPLAQALPEDTKLSGPSVGGSQVSGDLAAAADEGATELKVQYALTNSGCYVGGHPNPVLDGCFAAEGSLQVDGSATVIPFTHDAATMTTNGRTIQGFSTGAESKMQAWPTYMKFKDYYGEFDYANQWVIAAFASTSTSFTNGNANFASYGFDGRTEAIKKGTAYMNVWMYVIHEMEDAIADCNKGCDTTACNDDAVHAWDEAVAFYSGSLEGTDGSGEGVLIYSLADKRCDNFNTCDGGTAMVNKNIISKFQSGKLLLAQEKCTEAEEVKKEIEMMMAVPLVQGTLRYAYIVGVQQTDTEKAKAEGAVFAASVLPLVHACSPTDAKTIYDNMRVGASSPPNFDAVKTAFESQYECMGITCDQVGGLYDTANSEYFEGAAPCGAASANAGNGSGSAALGTSAGLFAAGAAALLL